MVSTTFPKIPVVVDFLPQDDDIALFEAQISGTQKLSRLVIFYFIYDSAF